jgi:hypothetical protein
VRANGSFVRAGALTVNTVTGNSDDIAKKLDDYSMRVDTALTAFHVRY